MGTPLTMTTMRPPASLLEDKQSKITTSLIGICTNETLSAQSANGPPSFEDLKTRAFHDIVVRAYVMVVVAGCFLAAANIACSLFTPDPRYPGLSFIWKIVVLFVFVAIIVAASAWLIKDVHGPNGRQSIKTQTKRDDYGEDNIIFERVNEEDNIVFARVNKDDYKNEGNSEKELK